MEVESKPKPSSGQLFTVLCQKLATNPRLSAIVTADLRERHPQHATLPNYHSNGASEEDKVSLYSFYLRGLLANDFTEFKGGVAKAQAVVESEPEPEKPKRKAPSPEPVVEQKSRMSQSSEKTDGSPFEALIDARIKAVVEPMLANMPKEQASEPQADIRTAVREQLSEFRTKLLAEMQEITERQKKNILKALHEALDFIK